MYARAWFLFIVGHDAFYPLYRFKIPRKIITGKKGNFPAARRHYTSEFIVAANNTTAYTNQIYIFKIYTMNAMGDTNNSTGFKCVQKKKPFHGQIELAHRSSCSLQTWIRYGEWNLQCTVFWRIWPIQLPHTHTHKLSFDI